MPFIRTKNGLAESNSCQTRKSSLKQRSEEDFEEFDKSYFLDDIKMLEYRWAKCIELKGDMLKNK